jgi:hypothetical protein
MSPAKFRWGILFILVGGLLLLNNIDVLDWWVWEDVLSLWPLILIAIGVEKIFTKSKVEFIAYLAPVALAVTVIWVAFDANDGGTTFSRQGSRYLQTIDVEPGIQKIDAMIDLNEGDLRLIGTDTKLFRGRAGGWRDRPTVEYSLKDGVAHVDVKQRGRSTRWIQLGRWSGDGDWRFSLSNKFPVTLKCTGGSSSMTLDCRDLQLDDVEVDSEDGSVTVFIGTLRQSVRVKLTGEEGAFDVRVAPTSGVRVSGADESIGRLLKRIGLTESGQYYQSPGYDTLTPKIDLDLSSDISRFSLDYH